MKKQYLPPFAQTVQTDPKDILTESLGDGWGDKEPAVEDLDDWVIG